MLASARHDVTHDAAQSNQIAHGFMASVGNPDRRQFAGAAPTSEHSRIAPIGLDAFAWLSRDQRRRDDLATVAETDELAINAIAARSGLVTKGQNRPCSLQTPAKLG